MKPAPSHPHLVQTIRSLGRLAIILVFSLGVVILILALSGKFSAKVPTEAEPVSAPASWAANSTAVVRLVTLPRFEYAVGTIRSVHETTLTPKLLARVVEVNLKAGQSVHKGDVLVRLDDTDLRAKLQQAKAAVVSAQSQYEQAVRDERRSAQLVQSKTISIEQYEKDRTAVNATAAEFRRAREAVNEMQATLDWATIRSPIDGIVTDKKVDVGDTVSPGQVLVTLFDPKRMQLVATVRESLTQRLKPGQDIGVQVEALKKQCSGQISEIVPEAQSSSRSFQVKVTGPCPPGVYTGMFGRIQIPLEEEQILVVPRGAVQNIGQLELVYVSENGQIHRRAVRIGRKTIPGHPDDVEVLSGLREGETVVVHSLPRPAKEDANECKTSP